MGVTTDWEVLELSREQDIRERLGKLPRTLKLAYDEIYDRIQQKDGSGPVVANRAFQWVMCSAKPLSSDTLVAAVCQDYTSDHINEVDIDIDFVLGACQNLLVVDQKLNECRFSHLSVQEYLENHHWRYNEADALIGKVCLRLLNSRTRQELEEKFLSSESEVINKSWADFEHLRTNTKSNKGNRTSGINLLVEYSECYWMFHVQRCEKHPEVDSQLAEFLKKFLGSMNESSKQYWIWYRSRSVQDYQFQQRHNPAEFTFDPQSLETVLFSFTANKPIWILQIITRLVGD